MRRFALPILLALYAAAAVPTAAQQPRSAVKCACPQKLDTVIDTVEKNYTGYILQIDAQKRAAYEQRKSALRARAASLDAEACFYLLHEFLDGFSDPELDLLETSSGTTSPVPVKPARSESELKQYFEKNADRLDPIEGFWYTQGARYAIIRDKSPGRDLVALTLNHRPGRTGMVKAEFVGNGRRYRARLYGKNATLRTAATLSAGNLLQIGDDVWGREHTSLDSTDPSAPTFRRINQQTFVLSVPSSAAAYQKRWKALLAQHAQEIVKAETLILDLRGNPGGDLDLETLLAPYYRAASSQKRIKREWQPVTLSSPAQLAYFRSKTPPGVPSNEWQRFLKELSAHLGEIVPMPVARAVPRPSAIPGPKWFVIFVDNGTRGEAENFVLRSWTSSKVRVVGESTAGGADYLGQNELKFPGCGLRLRYPAFARSRDVESNGVNARGIQPDIYISPEENDPIAAILQRLPAATADRK